jgi:hypothetical protein
VKLKILFSFFAAVVFSQFVKAEVLFEGYYKVSQFKKHIGFLILRHELDGKTKHFKTTSYTRLAKNGFDMTESYQAVSDAQLMPISLNYLAASDKKNTKTIDVIFKKLKMSGTVIEDGKKININKEIQKDQFFSSALYYLLLNRKEGLKTDLAFDFKAITEEGPVVLPGKVVIDKKMITQGTLQLLKATNNFAGPEYENLITPRGEIISGFTPSTNIESQLVKDSKEATEGIKISASNLEKIFGNVPVGKINVYSAGK